MAEFKKGDMVNFERGGASISHTPIIAVNNTPDSAFGLIKLSQLYIIGCSSGWLPNYMRIAEFGLIHGSKYLFVSQDELVLS